MPDYLYWKNCQQKSIRDLLARFGLEIRQTHDAQADIPGSFWGDSEAGLIKNQLWVRADTPVHSLLHEACHFICMDNNRREELDTDAGGGYDEENGVCYLQILLADLIQDYSSEQTMREMDHWGYSFRLGSTKAWFTQDAEDAQEWLINYQLLSHDHKISYRVRN
ncbi:MAG: hypothetical protein ACWA5R_05585 [bacterium]